MVGNDNIFLVDKISWSVLCLFSVCFLDLSFFDLIPSSDAPLGSNALTTALVHIL